jgi:hypothetical protein
MKKIILPIAITACVLAAQFAPKAVNAPAAGSIDPIII